MTDIRLAYDTPRGRAWYVAFWRIRTHQNGVSNGLLVGIKSPCGATNTHGHTRKSVRMPYKDNTKKIAQDRAYREAHRAEIAAYREANREKRNAQSRAYHDEHRAEINERSRGYVAAHREEMIAYNRAYREANLEEVRARDRTDERRAKRNAYVRRNPDKNVTHVQNRKARMRGNGGKHTTAEWRALCAWFGNACLCCGAIGKLSRDHVIPLASGGSNNIENLQPLCLPCNVNKHAQTIDYRDPSLLSSFLASLQGS